MGLSWGWAGAALGAAAGVALQVGLEVFGQIEAPWSPVVIGLLAGWGVRQCDPTTATGVSYLRGAIASAVALAAIVGGPYLVAQWRAARDVTASVARPPGARAASTTSQAGDGTAAEEALAELPPLAERPRIPGNFGPPPLVDRPGQFSTWQFIFMAVGMLLAYELARGTEVRYDDEESADSATVDRRPAASDAPQGRAVEQRAEDNQPD